MLRCCVLWLGAAAAAAAFDPATNAHSSRRALPRAAAVGRAPPPLPRLVTTLAPRLVTPRMEVEVAPADRGLLDGYSSSTHLWPSIWDGKPYTAAVVPETAQRAALVTLASALVTALTLPHAPEYWDSAAVLESAARDLDSAGARVPSVVIAKAGQHASRPRRCSPAH